MSSTTALRFLSRIPVPGFGHAGVVATYAKNCTRAFHYKKLVPWAFPTFVGFYWFIWPAMGDDFKIRIGWMKAPPSEEDGDAAVVVLDAKALAAIAKAPIVGANTGSHDASEAQDEAQAAAQILKALHGDQSGMENEWDKFYAKSTVPGEEDDDDEEEEEEEEGTCLYFDCNAV